MCPKLRLTCFSHHFLGVAEGLEDNRLHGQIVDSRVHQDVYKDRQEVIRAETIRAIAGVLFSVQGGDVVGHGHQGVELQQECGRRTWDWRKTERLSSATAVFVTDTGGPFSTRPANWYERRSPL